MNGMNENMKERQTENKADTAYKMRLARVFDKALRTY